MTYTASEMREMAAKHDSQAKFARKQHADLSTADIDCISSLHLEIAEGYETTAQMLRQAADAMEAIRDHIAAADECVKGDDDVAAMLKFAETDQRLRKLAAMQDKGQG